MNIETEMDAKDEREDGRQKDEKEKGNEFNLWFNGKAEDVDSKDIVLLTLFLV